jgi:hypothetical protein
MEERKLGRNKHFIDKFDFYFCISVPKSMWHVITDTIRVQISYVSCCSIDTQIHVGSLTGKVIR